MDFPRPYTVFLILASLYLVLQLYLFLRLQSYFKVCSPDRRRQRFLSRLATAFFLLMLLPLAWRALFGWLHYDLIPSVLRAFFGVWVFGATGSALILLAYDLLRWLPSLFSPRPPAADVERRNFLKTGVGLAATAPFLVSGYGLFVGRQRFQVEHLELPLNGISSALSDLSIVQLSDIHVGPFMPPEELAAYVEAVNRLEPDLIALTGDFVATSRDEAAPCAHALAGLKARYGVFACMGNHDVFSGAEEELTRLFTQRGIQVLRNNAVHLRIKNTALNVLGIEDLHWGRPSLSRALNVVSRQPGEASLLLSHRPEIFPEATRRGIDVVLSGHYHGGQIKLNSDPESLSIARFLTPYAEGLFRLSSAFRPSEGDARNSILFVSRGIGITGLPIRINCPPQIAHLTLKRA